MTRLAPGTTGARPAFFARERQQLILAIVSREGRALVAELATRFGVSEQTIRKDLLLLKEERLLVKTHGGAIAVDRHRPELAFDVRRGLEADAKRRIGIAAAALVEDGETIALDASTTALEVARRIQLRSGWERLTVVTNGIRIAEELAGHDGITVLLPAGRMRWNALSVVGPWGDGFLKRINVSRAFLGAAGFTMQAGLTDATEEEAQIKRAMVAAAHEVTAVVDGSKWGRAALATFCRTDRIARVVTDAPAPADMVAALARVGVPLVQAVQTDAVPSAAVDHDIGSAGQIVGGARLL